ncbi:MAG: class B sortase [Lachnospiraceae bacterium]|nr:class B sortase [Lachnospiraceae bacterium]
MNVPERCVHILNKAEDLAVFLLCLCLFFVGTYGLYDSFLIVHQANDDSILKYKPGSEDDIPEQKISGNMTAWLTLEGTEIDDPVMQGEDNFEYLNKNPYGEYSLAGSIYLDSRNSPDYSDEYSLLYGHHMENSAMFGDLDLYRQEKFFREYTEGTLTVGDEVRKITVIAVLNVSATDPVIFSPENRTKEEILDKIRRDHMYYRQAEGEQLIAFSTCRYPDTTERTVVVGVLEQSYELQQ